MSKTKEEEREPYSTATGRTDRNGMLSDCVGKLGQLALAEVLWSRQLEGTLHAGSDRDLKEEADSDSDR